jgi:prophage DNA circulation protein
MASISLWRRNLMPASFRGVSFHVRADSKSGGRRLVIFEYPKKNQGYAEDMGKRLKRFRMSAYILFSPVICPDYQGARDALIAALDADGSGQLIHPLMGIDQVEIDHWTCVETQERGGEAVFEVELVEAGSQVFASGVTNTNQAVAAAAAAAAAAFVKSSDIQAAAAGLFAT